MKLMQVKKGRSLHWPDSFPTENDGSRFRGKEGYVVDLDAPLESEWCGRMLHVLEPAAKDAVPTPIEHPVALRQLKAAAKTAKAEADAPPAKPTVGGALPTVDPVPQRKTVAAK